MTNKEIYEQFEGNNRKKLLKFIRRKVSDDHTAEDIFQDICYLFFNTLQNEPIEKISSWLYHAAENKIIDWYRKRKTLSLDNLNEQKNKNSEDNEISLRLEDVLFEPGQTADELYLRSKVWILLADALEELPAEQKEVFVLHELEGKSFKEISELKGVSVNTLISRKRYAILFLREELKELYDEFFLN